MVISTVVFDREQAPSMPEDRIDVKLLVAPGGWLEPGRDLQLV